MVWFCTYGSSTVGGWIRYGAVQLMLNSIVQGSGVQTPLAASNNACRKEPIPLSLVLTTVMVLPVTSTAASMLLFASGSASSAVAVPVTVCVPAVLVVVSPMETLRFEPLRMLPTLHVTVPAEKLHVPASGVALL